MRVFMLGLGLVGIVGCGPAAEIPAEDKQVFAIIETVAMPPHGVHAGTDSVRIDVWFEVKDCPPLGTLRAKANGVELSTYQNGRYDPGPFALTTAQPSCRAWEFTRTVPRGALGAGPDVTIEIEGDAHVATVVVPHALQLASPEGTSVNEAFTIRFPGPAPELDEGNCTVDRNGGLLTFDCGPRTEAGPRQLFGLRWKATTEMKCTDAVCPQPARVSMVQGLTYSCAKSEKAIDCAWD